MIELVEAATELQAFCEERSWGFCFIGGLALQHWGEPRLTIDVDATLLTGIGREATFIAALLERFPARVNSAAAFAVRHRVLLIRSSTGIPFDVALGGLPFEAEAVRRSRLIFLGGDVPLRLCSAEDLVVMKAFADRGRDWLDIEGVLIRQGTALDWVYLLDQLRPLVEAKEAPDILPRLEALRCRTMES
ncbi:MAG: hypothetical protein ABI587_14325 [Gemmatimonadales bacterium]